MLKPGLADNLSDHLALNRRVIYQQDLHKIIPFFRFYMKLSCGSDFEMVIYSRYYNFCHQNGSA